MSLSGDGNLADGTPAVLAATARLWDAKQFWLDLLADPTLDNPNLQLQGKQLKERVREILAQNQRVGFLPTGGNGSPLSSVKVRVVYNAIAFAVIAGILALTWDVATSQVVRDVMSPWWPSTGNGNGTGGTFPILPITGTSGDQNIPAGVYQPFFRSGTLNFHE
jgi:hypothetical protein